MPKTKLPTIYSLLSALPWVCILPGRGIIGKYPSFRFYWINDKWLARVGLFSIFKIGKRVGFHLFSKKEKNAVLKQGPADQ